jgi:hypothetical protein
MMEALPPRKGALLQDSNRAVYQASTWTTADQPLQQTTSLFHGTLFDFHPTALSVFTFFPRIFNFFDLSITEET